MLLERVLAWSDRTPDAPALVSETQSVSHRQLRALVSRAVIHLRQQGIRAGDRVALQISQAPLQPILFLALGWIGALVVPVSAAARPEARAELLRKFSIGILVAERLEVVAAGCRLVQFTGVGARGDELMDDAGAPGFEPETPLRLLMTSGTTGQPKAVLQTHAGFEQRMDGMHCDVAEVPRVLPPALHIHIALHLALHALCKGGALVFPRSFATGDFLQAIARHGVTHVILPPASLALMLPALPLDAPAFPGVRQLRIVGTTPTRALLEAARRRFSPHVYVTYGIAEIGLVSMATPEIAFEDPPSVGILEPGVRMEFLADGEIRLFVPGQPQDYFGPDAGDGTRFRDGWFHPGDRGRLSREGRLHLEGRTDHLINVGGRKVAPEYVEAILMEFEGVREAGVFPVSAPEGDTRLAAAIVPTGRLDWAALDAHARRRSLVAAPSRYLEVTQLPRNAMGKLERDLLSEAALAAAPVRLG